MEKETIKPGKFVELVFDLYKINDDGSESLVHEVTDEAPECVVFGVTEGMIKPLEAALEGLAAGDAYDVVAMPDEAFARLPGGGEGLFRFAGAKSGIPTSFSLHTQIK